eukprot:GHVS01046450.1.p1 GENE.GHVS01046450.1~~GHVS01046450.1.p1  ORF type:complete len:197 (-),score=25.77 GHVS01046450.1:17-607(-)
MESRLIRFIAVDGFTWDYADVAHQLVESRVVWNVLSAEHEHSTLKREARRFSPYLEIAIIEVPSWVKICSLKEASDTKQWEHITTEEDNEEIKKETTNGDMKSDNDGKNETFTRNKRKDVFGIKMEALLDDKRKVSWFGFTDTTVKIIRAQEGGISATLDSGEVGDDAEEPKRVVHVRREDTKSFSPGFIFVLLID